MANDDADYDRMRRREALAAMGAAGVASVTAGVASAAPAEKPIEQCAFQATAVATAYGPGGHVMGSFLCATEADARRLEAFLRALNKGDKPRWAK